MRMMMALVASSRVPLRSTLRVKNQISRSLLNYIKPQFSVTFLARFDLYHTTSAVLMAKKNKQEKKEKTKGKGTQQEEKTNGDELIEVKLPDVALIAGKMDRAVQRFERELAKLRTGRVTADMFSDLEVGSYGQLSHLAQVTMKNATTLSITTFDPSMAKDVSDAVRDCGMNLNPTTEGNTVIVVVPKPSKESRQALSKTVSRIAEKIKQDLRQIRKNGLDAAKKCKGDFSEDDLKRCSKEIENHTEKAVENIHSMAVQKEKEIMQA